MGNDNQDIGLFDENPDKDKPHVVNYIHYISDIIRRYRNSLPPEDRGQTAFGAILGRYFGTPVPRQRIASAENGNVGTAWGVFVAIFSEMGVLPEIVNVLEQGHRPTLRYMLLVKNAMADKLEHSARGATEALNRKAVQESKQGLVGQ